jgi:hypothetical protein
MKLATLIFVAAALVLPAAAHADCAMELQDLKAKTARITDKQKRAAVTKELNKTLALGRGSETDCLNGAARTRRLINAPDPDPIKPVEHPQVNWN